MTSGDKNGRGSVLMDASEVAEMLKCSERHVLRLAKAGELPPPIKLGRLSRWTWASIRTWIDDGCPTWDSLHSPPPPSE